MTDHEQTEQNLDFKDRKTGLILFGIIQLIFGGFSALMIPLMMVGVAVSSHQGDNTAMGTDTRMIIPGVMFYTLLAVWFIWMGIGSIKTRRWARALILVSSWMWLVFGTIALIFMLLFMPDIYGQLAQDGQISGRVISIIKYMTLVFMAVIYVFIPGVLVFFYGSKHVKATCEHRDPQIRWTDKCPLPVLAVSLMFAGWMCTMPLLGVYNWAIPFFGYILSGFSGAVAAMITALLSAYIAWGTYKLKIQAWWCAVVLTIGWAISSAISFSGQGLLEFYQHMNIPEQDLAFLEQSGMLQGSTMGISTGLWLACLLVYLLFQKKHFKLPSAQENAAHEAGT